MSKEISFTFRGPLDLRPDPNVSPDSSADTLSDIKVEMMSSENDEWDEDTQDPLTIDEDKFLEDEPNSQDIATTKMENNSTLNHQTDAVTSSTADNEKGLGCSDNPILLSEDSSDADTGNATSTTTSGDTRNAVASTTSGDSGNVASTTSGDTRNAFASFIYGDTGNAVVSTNSRDTGNAFASTTSGDTRNTFASTTSGETRNAFASNTSGHTGNALASTTSGDTRNAFAALTTSGDTRNAFASTTSGDTRNTFASTTSGHTGNALASTTSGDTRNAFASTTSGYTGNSVATTASMEPRHESGAAGMLRNCLDNFIESDHCFPVEGSITGFSDSISAKLDIHITRRLSEVFNNATNEGGGVEYNRPEGNDDANANRSVELVRELFKQQRVFEERNSHITASISRTVQNEISRPPTSSGVNITVDIGVGTSLSESKTVKKQISRKKSSSIDARSCSINPDLNSPARIGAGTSMSLSKAVQNQKSRKTSNLIDYRRGSNNPGENIPAQTSAGTSMSPSKAVQNQKSGKRSNLIDFRRSRPTNNPGENIPAQISAGTLMSPSKTGQNQKSRKTSSLSPSKTVQSQKSRKTSNLNTNTGLPNDQHRFVDEYLHFARSTTQARAVQNETSEAPVCFSNARRCSTSPGRNITAQMGVDTLIRQTKTVENHISRETSSFTSSSISARQTGVMQNDVSKTTPSFTGGRRSSTSLPVKIPAGVTISKLPRVHQSNDACLENSEDQNVTYIDIDSQSMPFTHETHLKTLQSTQTRIETIECFKNIPAGIAVKRTHFGDKTKRQASIKNFFPSEEKKIVMRKSSTESNVSVASSLGAEDSSDDLQVIGEFPPLADIRKAVDTSVVVPPARRSVDSSATPPPSRKAIESSDALVPTRKAMATSDALAPPRKAIESSDALAPMRKAIASSDALPPTRKAIESSDALPPTKKVMDTSDALAPRGTKVKKVASVRNPAGLHNKAAQYRDDPRAGRSTSIDTPVDCSVSHNMPESPCSNRNMGVIPRRNSGGDRAPQHGLDLSMRTSTEDRDTLPHSNVSPHLTGLTSSYTMPDGSTARNTSSGDNRGTQHGLDSPMRGPALVDRRHTLVHSSVSPQVTRLPNSNSVYIGYLAQNTTPGHNIGTQYAFNSPIRLQTPADSRNTLIPILPSSVSSHASESPNNNTTNAGFTVRNTPSERSVHSSVSTLGFDSHIRNTNAMVDCTPVHSTVSAQRWLPARENVVNDGLSTENTPSRGGTATQFGNDSSIRSLTYEDYRNALVRPLITGSSNSNTSNVGLPTRNTPMGTKRATQSDSPIRSPIIEDSRKSLVHKSVSPHIMAVTNSNINVPQDGSATKNSPPGDNKDLKCKLDVVDIRNRPIIDNISPHIMTLINSSTNNVEKFEVVSPSKSSSFLKIETKSGHGGFPAQNQQFQISKQPPFDCDICGKSFGIRSHLILHSKKHETRRISDTFIYRQEESEELHIMPAEEIKSETIIEDAVDTETFNVSSQTVDDEEVNDPSINTAETDDDRSLSRDDAQSINTAETDDDRSLSRDDAESITADVRFECGICSRRFSDRHNLILHKRSHSKRKFLKCTECNRRFSKHHHLKMHLSTHKRPRHCCKYCGKLFKLTKHLANHEMSHEQGLLDHRDKNTSDDLEDAIETKDGKRDTEPEKGGKVKSPFMCQICGKCFQIKSHLLLHNRRHEFGVIGSKPHKSRNVQKSREKSLSDKETVSEEDDGIDDNNKSARTERNSISDSRRHEFGVMGRKLRRATSSRKVRSYRENSLSDKEIVSEGDDESDEDKRSNNETTGPERNSISDSRRHEFGVMGRELRRATSSRKVRSYRENSLSDKEIVSEGDDESDEDKRSNNDTAGPERNSISDNERHEFGVIGRNEVGRNSVKNLSNREIVSEVNDESDDGKQRNNETSRAERNSISDIPRIVGVFSLRDTDKNIVNYNLKAGDNVKYNSDRDEASKSSDSDNDNNGSQGTGDDASDDNARDNADDRFDCDVCPKSFKLKWDLYVHKRVHLENKKMYKCAGKCGKECSRRFSKPHHLRMHLKAKNRCKYCGKRFKMLHHLTNHEKTHNQALLDEGLQDADTSRKDVFESGSETSRSDLNGSNESFSGTTEDPFICKICEKTFKLYSHLVLHSKKHELGIMRSNRPIANRSDSEKGISGSEKTVKTKRATIPATAFRKKVSFEGSETDNSVIEVRSDDDDNLSEKGVSGSERIEKTFKTKRSTIPATAFRKKGPFEACPIPETSFEASIIPERSFEASPIPETSFEASRIPEGSFRCDTCSKCFTSQAFLDVHVVRIHQVSPRKFEMSSASIDTTTQESSPAVIHSEPNISNDSTSTQFDCNFCGRHLTTKGSLIRHKKMYHGVNESTRIECDMCDVRCASQASLILHRQRKHGHKIDVSQITQDKNGENKQKMQDKNSENKQKAQEKNEQQLFSCLICNRSFISKRNLQAHNLIHQRISELKSLLGSKAVDSEAETQPESFETNETETQTPSDIIETSGTSKNTVAVSKPSLGRRLVARNWRSYSNVREKCRRNLSGKSEVFECDVCGQGFRQRSRLRIHRSKHQGFECKICQRKFAYFHQLRRHKISHRRDANSDTEDKDPDSKADSLTCRVCKKTLSNECSLKRHLKLHNGKERYKCQICNQKFNSYNVCNDHCLKSHGSDVQKPMMLRNRTGGRATTVDRKLDGSQNQSSDEKEALSHGENSVLDLCPEMNTDEGHGHKPHTYTCSVCNKILSNKQTLRRHLWLHAGVKPYKCQICNQRFAHYYSCKEHCDKSHGSDIRKPKYVSIIDGKKRVRIIYRKSLDGSQNNPKENKTSSCDESIVIDLPPPKSNSDANFVSNTEEEKGAKSNSVESTSSVHTCRICKKSLASQLTLMQHLRIHTGEKPYKCQICNQLFTYYRSCQQHCKRKHGSDRKPVLIPKSDRKLKIPIETLVTAENNIPPANGLSEVGAKSDETIDPINSTERSGEVEPKDDENIAEQSRVEVKQPPGKPFVCSFCGKSFPISSHLKLHLKRHEQTQRLDDTAIENAVSENPDVNTPHTEEPGNESILPEINIDSRSIDINVGSDEMKSDDVEQEGITVENNGIIDCQQKTNAPVARRQKRASAKVSNCRWSSRWRCKICKKALYNFHSLKRHEFTHMVVKPLKCPKCPKTFGDKYDLKRHVGSHIVEKRLKCPKCPRTFCEKYRLKRHQDGLHHHSEKDGKIRETSDNPTDTSTHQEHNTLNDKNLERNNDSVDSSDDNQLNSKSSGDDNAIEGEGDTSEMSQSPLDINAGPKVTEGQRIDIKTTVKGLAECHICGKKVKYLNDHLKIHTGKRPYNCPICHKKFARSHNRLRHLRLHKKSTNQRSEIQGVEKNRVTTESKPFECRICHRQYADKRDLKIHKLQCRGNRATLPDGNAPKDDSNEIDRKPVEGKSRETEKGDENNEIVRQPVEENSIATEKGDENNEILRQPVEENSIETEKGDENNETFRQPVEGKSIATEKGDENNEIVRQPVEENCIEREKEVSKPNFPPPGKAHCCKICGKRFGMKSCLGLHMITHEGEKCHECEICHQKFSKSGSLVRHIRLKHGSRIRRTTEDNIDTQCEICHRKFKSGGLVLHLRLKHGYGVKRTTEDNIDTQPSGRNDQVESQSSRPTETSKSDIMLNPLDIKSNTYSQSSVTSEANMSHTHSQSTETSEADMSHAYSQSTVTSEVDMSNSLEIQNITENSEPNVLNPLEIKSNTSSQNTAEISKSDMSNPLEIKPDTYSQNSTETSKPVSSPLESKSITFSQNSTETSKPDMSNSLEIKSDAFSQNSTETSKPDMSNSLEIQPDIFYQNTTETSKPDMSNSLEIKPDIFYQNTTETSKPDMSNLLEIKPDIFYQNSTETLKPDMSIPTGSTSNAHTCGVCNKTLSSQYKLQQHLTIHTGVARFPCLICNERFTTYYRLKKHIGIQHGSKALKKMVGRQRIRVISRPTDGKSPEEKKTSPPDASNVHDSSPSQGSNESDNFVRNITQKQHNIKLGHTRVRTKLGPLSCRVCKKVLSCKATLASHMRLHTGEKPYNCQNCNEWFTNWLTRKVHQAKCGSNAPESALLIKTIDGRRIIKKLDNSQHRSQKDTSSPGKKSVTDPSLAKCVSSSDVQEQPSEGVLPSTSDVPKVRPRLKKLDDSQNRSQKEISSPGKKIVTDPSPGKRVSSSDAQEQPAEGALPSTSDVPKVTGDNKVVEPELLGCNICGKRFSTKYYASIHRRIHARVTNNTPKKRKLDRSEGTESPKRKVRKLEGRKNPINIISIGKNMFGCVICGEQFSAKNVAERHVKIHFKKKIRQSSTQRESMADEKEPASKRKSVTPKKQPDSTPKKRSELTLPKRSEVTPKKQSEITPNRQSEVTPRRQSAMMPPKQSEITPKRHSEVTPKGQSAMMPPKQSEITPKRQSTITPQKRSEITPKKRSYNSGGSAENKVVKPRSGGNKSADVDSKKTDPLRCPICHKRFSRADYMRAHQTSHTGERPFPCRFCSETFQRRSTRWSHEKIKHNFRAREAKKIKQALTKPPKKPEAPPQTQTGERTYPCRFCSETFRLRGSRWSHEKRTHKMRVVEVSKPPKKTPQLSSPTPRERLFQCGKCGQRFMYTKNLETHVNKVHKN